MFGVKAMMPRFENMPERAAARFRIRGLVQGVGFRPFVYRLARELDLAGWVCNDAEGVFIQAEGTHQSLVRFEQLLDRAGPAAAVVDSVTREPVLPSNTADFRILPSRGEGQGPDRARVPPDRAACAACCEEVFDPRERRHGYPLTTCTECGPRYSILSGMPYDRPLTSMNQFALCPSCLQEYELPDSRRFHAQPIACPDCGPQVAIWDERGREVGREAEAIRMAARRLCAGEILAVKGLGGFQLLARADIAGPVVRLRRCKGRPSKPLAVMVKSVEAAESLVRLTPAERHLLESPANPIVLAEKSTDLSTQLAPEIAPRMNRLGVLLPTTPLHHLLLAEVDFAVMATSGNRGDEPIVTDEREALVSLAGLADAFLVHDRPVVHRVDDSVFRVITGREVAVRLARGYTPLSLPALERWAGASAPPAGVLATGAQQKVSLALWSGAQAILSPHVGDIWTGRGPGRRSSR
jgi:hydrogenase maturation protein HypF